MDNTEAQHTTTVLRRPMPYYGWYIAVTLALTETVSWGIVYYAFSVFLTPMQHDLGWTRSELTGGFSLSLLVTGLMAFPVGAWIDKHGARLLMTIGASVACILVIAWSQVTTLTAFYLIWIGLGACAAAILYEPAFAVIAQWFKRERGTALAIVTFAAGLASTIFLPLSDALLHAVGWRTAVLLLGLFLGIVTIPLHALMLRKRPNETKGHPSDMQRSQVDVSLGNALRGSTFWLLTLSFGLVALATAAIRVHFIPFLIGSGISASTAAFATGTIGIMQVVGRAIFAPLERRWSSGAIVVGVFGLQTISLSVLLIGQTPVLIGLFIVLFGMAQGSMTLVRPALLADLFGSTHYGRISSVMAIFLTVAATIAPIGASLVFDAAHSYQPVLWIVVVIATIAALTAYAAKRYAFQS